MIRLRSFGFSGRIVSKAVVILFFATQLVVLNVVKKGFENVEQLMSTSAVIDDEVNFNVTEAQTTTSNSPTTPPRYTMLYDDKPKNDSKIYILLATKTIKSPCWNLGKDIVGEDELKSVKCPVLNCVATFNNNTIDYGDFDAVIFNVHYHTLNAPPIRRPRQHYIMASVE
jgi:hypothetical protein